MVSMITAATSPPASAASIASRSLKGTWHELVGLIGQEQLGEPVVAGRHRQAGVAVIGLDDRDDLAALRRVPGGLDRDVDGLAAAAAVDDLGQARLARS